MKPYLKLDEARLPDGRSLELYTHDGDYFIQQDGEIIMTSRAHSSEEDLSTLGCAPIQDRADARVLVGGLGLGYTLKAALEVLPPTAKVVVSEILPAVLRWNEEHVGHLCGHPLKDPRVEVRLEDVTDIIGNSRNEWDAMLLDVDNAPDSHIVRSNAGMYSPGGLAVCRRALTKGGILAIWSGGTTRGFTRRLESSGFEAREHHVHPRGVSGTLCHSIWIARRDDEPGRVHPFERGGNRRPRGGKGSAPSKGRAPGKKKSPGKGTGKKGPRR